MKTPLLEYVPLEEDEEKGNTVTTTTSTPQEEEEDESDPEFIEYMKQSRDVYFNNKRHRYRNINIFCLVLVLFIFLSLRDHYKEVDPLCTNESGRTLFSGQPYTIYATGNNDTIYTPIAITVPSEEHCTYLKRCTKAFNTLICFVKPTWVKTLWTIDVLEEEEETGTLAPINQFNAGL